MDSFWIVLFYLESLMSIFCHLNFTGCNFMLKFFFKASTRLNEVIKPLIIFQGVPRPSVPRQNKPRRVDLYYSSWCIRPGTTVVS